MATMIKSTTATPQDRDGEAPTKEQADFTRAFMERIGRDEFAPKKLNKMDDNALSHVIYEASCAYKGINPKDPYRPDKVAEKDAIETVFQSARAVLDGRSRNRNEARDAQRRRLGKIIAFAHAADKLMRCLEETAFDPSALFPEAAPAITPDEARAANLHDLTQTAHDAEREASQYDWDMGRVADAVYTLSLFGASGCIEVARDDLQACLDRLSEFVAGKREASEVASAEIRRRMREEEGRRRAEMELPATVEALRRRIDELESDKAVRR